jgi:leucyl aminopeptidase
MAKEIMKVRVKAGAYDPEKTRTELLAVGVFSDGRDGKYLRSVDRLLAGAVGQVRKLGDFKAKEGTTAVLYGDKARGPQRVLLVGLGERKKMEVETFRRAAVKAACAAVDLRVGKCVLALDADAPAGRLDAEHLGEALCGGACFGAYRYDEYVSDNDEARAKKLEVVIAEGGATRGPRFARGMKTGNTVGQAQSFARTIMNRPANVISPGALAAIAGKLAKETPGLSCTVLDDRQIKAKGMGGLMAVGQGSANRPRLIVLKYSAGARGGKDRKTIGLVGKAITFDSGGISIKPSAGMQDMKFDKSGGVAVLGAMKAIAELKCGVDVYGIIPSAENMPGGMSYRPGDIVETYSGKTVEIQNTDAEGRMILCDAIAYAKELKCDAIVDIATLTGACVVALGEGMAGVMGHSDKLVEKVRKASERSGEKVWHLPCGEEFLEQMKSKIADLKNIGGKWGGACTAGAFLGEFAGDVEWAHIDMAGTGMVDGATKYGTSGSIGFGVRLLTALVAGFGS